jgi:hypothetical protein
MQYLPFAQLPFRRHLRKLSTVSSNIFPSPNTTSDIRRIHHEAEQRKALGAKRPA